jgi:sulfate-transporting ATPase
VDFFTGNYSDFEADKIKRLGDKAKLPHRIKYKKLEH